MTRIVEPQEDRVLITNRFLMRDFGTCLKFDGTTSYVTLGSNTLNVINSSDNKFTISGWIKGYAAGGRIFSEASTSTNTQAYDIICDPTNPRKIQLWVRNNSNSQLVLATTTQNILDNDWHFITYTDDNGAVSIYRDAVLMTGTELNYTRAGSTFTINATRLGVRSIATPSLFFRGQMDDFRIFKGAILTQQEIEDIYLLGKNPSTPSAWYEMDEGSGSSLTDSSGNGNTGAITSATYSTDVFMKPRVEQTRNLTTDYAIEFDGSQNYGTLGNLVTFGSNIGNGFYCKFKIKTTATGIGSFGFGATSAQILRIGFNKSKTEANLNHALQITVRNNVAGSILRGAAESPTINFNDGNTHEIEYIVLPATNSITINIDGVSQTITYQEVQSPTGFVNLGSNPFCIGGSSYNGALSEAIACTIDDFIIGTNSSTLYGSYNFNEGSGIELRNQTGGINGVLMKGAGAYPSWVTGL